MCSKRHAPAVTDPLPNHWLLRFVVGMGLLGNLVFADTSNECPKVVRISTGGAVVVVWKGKESTLDRGQAVGPWHLMAVVQGSSQPLAVFEDFSQLNGRLIFVDRQGVKVDLPKSFEPTWADTNHLYRGHTLEEVLKSERDLLGEEILAKPGDPEYSEVAACFPPLSKMYTYSFVGTHDCSQKVGVFYGGSTPNFDPAA